MEKSAEPGRAAAGSRFLIDFLSDPRRWGVLVAVVLSAGAIWTGLSAVPMQGVSGGATSAPREGFLAPDFRLTLLGGGEVALSELRGQVVIVNLWASWCPPCRAEMPALQEAYEAYRDRGLEILAVNTTYQDSQAAAARFVLEYGLTFPVPMDQTGEVSRSYLLRALPTSFIIEREAPKHRLSGTTLGSLVFYGLVAGLLGARLGYAVRYWTVYAEDPLGLVSLNPNTLSAE